MRCRRHGDLNDGQPIEVGVRFRADQSGVITALRYYKGATWPAGTRTGHLWTADGAPLATASSPGSRRPAGSRRRSRRRSP